jgi:hypothetical protein
MRKRVETRYSKKESERVRTRKKGAYGTEKQAVKAEVVSEGAERAFNIGCRSS